MRLLDTMLFRYFYVAGLLESLLRLPQIGITTAVRKEVKLKWRDSAPELIELLDKAITAGHLVICDVDPDNQQETFLYSKYWDIEGFGDGESASMAVAYCRGHTFISHDFAAVSRMRSLGVKVGDWPDLLREIADSGYVSEEDVVAGKKAISGLMSGL